MTRLGSTVFVGRGAELSELRTLLAEARAGRGGLVLVEGEPGIGKTRLAEELARRVRRHVVTLWTRCWEDEGGPAYWPWVQIARACLGRLGPDRLAAAPRCAELAPILPEIELLPTEGGGPLDEESARFRLFAGVTELVRQTAQLTPLLIVLDDLHWADPESLLLTRFVAREVEDARVLLLATYREEEIGDRRAAAFARLARDGRRIGVGGLAPAEVASLLEAMTGRAPSASVATAMHARTEGNPLFLGEIVRFFEGAGDWLRGAASGSEIPPSVRQVIRSRLDRLPAECRRVLAVASVLGRVFDLPRLAAMLERERTTDDGASLGRLEAAVAARVLVPLGRSPAAYRFSHALVREALYEELSAPTRSALHRHAASILERLDAGQSEPRVAERAHHLLATGSAADARTAARCSLAAAAQAKRRLAFADAVEHCRDALRALDRLQSARPGAASDALALQERCSTLLALGEAQTQAGEPERGRASFLAAAELARRAGSAEGLARAALGFAGRGDVVTASDARARELLEEALGALPGADSPHRARLLGRLALVLPFSEAQGEREGFSRSALVMAERLGDTATLAFCLSARHMALLGPDAVPQRLEVAERIVELATRARSKELLAAGHFWRLYDHLELAEIDAVDRNLAAFGALADELRTPFLQWQWFAFRTMRSLLEGRFADAKALAGHAFDLGRRAKSPNAELIFTVHDFVRRRELGELGELEAPIRALLEHFPGVHAFRSGLALILCESGRKAEAALLFDRLAAAGFASLPRDVNWLNAMEELALTCAHLGDAARAAILYDLLLPYAERTVVIGFADACDGAVSRYLGLLATTMERWDEAEEHFRHARALNARLGAAPFVAHAERELADVLIARGRAEDGDRAAALARSALAIYEDLRMERFAERARETAARAEQLRWGRADPALPGAAGARRIFRAEGDFWSLGDESLVVHVRSLKGLAYVARLLRHPEREFHVADLLVAVEGGPSPPMDSDTTPRPDGQAIAAYRRRLEEARDELDEAEMSADIGRAQHLREEVDFLLGELCSRYGIGARAGGPGTVAERMRKAVTNRIRHAIACVERVHPALGRHLKGSVRTGLFCVYAPERPETWVL